MNEDSLFFVSTRLSPDVCSTYCLYHFLKRLRQVSQERGEHQDEARYLQFVNSCPLETKATFDPYPNLEY
jgi:hypothetical protein